MDLQVSTRTDLTQHVQFIKTKRNTNVKHFFDYLKISTFKLQPDIQEKIKLMTIHVDQRKIVTMTTAIKFLNIHKHYTYADVFKNYPVK